MADEPLPNGERGRHPRARARRSRPSLSRAELVAYNWGGRLFDVDPDRVMAWFVTKVRPDRNMSDDEQWSYDELGFDRFWLHAWNGLNDAAQSEL